jgi:hypothetical protein
MYPNDPVSNDIQSGLIIAGLAGALAYFLTKDVKKAAIVGGASFMLRKPIGNVAYRVIKSS